MTYFAVAYLPQSFGTLVDHKFTASDQETFQVQLGLDEHWHVSSATTTPNTEYELSLVGRPINPMRPGEFAPDTFTYNWTMVLSEQPGSFVSYGFDVKVPLSQWGDTWFFELIAEGHGTVHVTISKLDRATFTVFLVVVGVAVILNVILLVRWAKGRNKSNNQTSERVSTSQHGVRSIGMLARLQAD